MINQTTPLPIDIVLDESIYPPARIAQKIAEKHTWPEPLVWSLALEGKDDHDQFKQPNYKPRGKDLRNYLLLCE